MQLAAGGGYASGLPSPTNGGASGSPTGASADAHDDSTDQYRTVVPHTVKPRNEKGPFLRAAEAAFGCVMSGEFASNEIRTAKYTVRLTAGNASPHHTAPHHCSPAATVLLCLVSLPCSLAACAGDLSGVVHGRYGALTLVPRVALGGLSHCPLGVVGVV